MGGLAVVEEDKMRSILTLPLLQPVKTALVTVVFAVVTLIFTLAWSWRGMNPTMLPVSSHSNSRRMGINDNDGLYTRHILNTKARAVSLSMTRTLSSTPGDNTLFRRWSKAHNQPFTPAVRVRPCRTNLNLTVLGKRLDTCAVSQAVKLAKEEDIYMSVKTTSANHEGRILPDILTWFQTLNPKQIHVVTDVVSEDEPLYQIANKTGLDVVTTDCPKIHSNLGLCCKTRNEYFRYFNTTKESGELHKWFCHFDDDMYANIPVLVPALREAMNKSADGGVYFGRWPREKVLSTPKGLRVSRRTLKSLGYKFRKTLYVKWATGAAYCISSTIMKIIKNLLGKHTFEKYCAAFGVSDDVTAAILVGIAGYVVSDYQTVITHYDKLTEIPVSELPKMITSSHRHNNVINVPDTIFSFQEDKTRFLTYHCLLYPSTSWCKKSS